MVDSVDRKMVGVVATTYTRSVRDLESKAGVPQAMFHLLVNIVSVVYEIHEGTVKCRHAGT